jgi:hypothetical protein
MPKTILKLPAKHVANRAQVTQTEQVMQREAAKIERFYYLLTNVQNGFSIQNGMKHGEGLSPLL